MARIITPSKKEHYSSIASLMREYHAWIRMRYAGERIWEVDDYFDVEAWNHELASLPEIYIPPIGELMLSIKDKQPAGCIALKAYNETICELKRLFVKEKFRGMGLGHQLVKGIIAKAREYGYSSIRLEFGELFTESRSLYQSIGFTHIEPYTDIPDRLKPKMRFMELQL